MWVGLWGFFSIFDTIVLYPKLLVLPCGVSLIAGLDSPLERGTGMWDWNACMWDGIFNCYSRPYNTLSTLNPSVGTSHKQSMGGLLDR